MQLRPAVPAKRHRAPCLQVVQRPEDAEDAEVQPVQPGRAWVGADRPQTNGKAERFIQSALRERAYGRIYENSD